jgi:DNA polymerase-3 subunit alpha
MEIEECQNMGINVAPPDVNDSFETFTVVAPTESQNKGEEEYTPTIRFGLNAVKNVGENIAEVIIKERKENGPYKDTYDFLERVTNKDLNRKSLESLIKSGCFDCFEERGKLFGNIDNLLSFNKEACRIRDSKQANLFADAPEMIGPARAQLSETEPIDRQQMLSWEKELLGLYISEHPFNDYKKHLQNIAVPLSELAGMEGKKVNAAGVVSSVKKITTKNSKTMLFVKIEEVLSGAELLIFPELYEQTKEKWEEGKVVLFQGKVSDKDQEIKILTEKVHFLNLDNIESDVEKFRQEAGTLIHSGNSAPAGNRAGYHQDSSLKIIMEKRLEGNKMNELKDLFLNNPGGSKVYFKVNGSGNVIESGFRVNNNRELVEQIKQRFSDGIKVVD